MENNLILNENSWVCKDNKLVNASYKLNLGELKLILAISSMVNPNDERFKDYVITIKEFAKLLNINLNTNKNFYGRIKRASGLLISKRVTIHEADGDFQTVWLSGIKYYDDEGKVAVSFHPRLIKYYLQLHQYTKYRLKNIIDLNSEYSLKFYEVLKQYEKLGERTFEINELKKFLNVENLYKRYYNFKKRILLVIEKEINEKTDISIRFEEIKTGRSITNLKFYIKDNNIVKKPKVTKVNNKTIAKIKINNQFKASEEICASKSVSDDEPINKIVQMMTDKHIIPLEARKIYDSSTGKIDIIYKVYNHFKNQNANNFVGLMINQVKPGVFQESKKNYKKGNFSDVDERNYTNEELNEIERKLLGLDNYTDSTGQKYNQVTFR